jgi:hypothetical protein
MTPIASPSFESLKSDLAAYPRLCGYYLLKLVDITTLRRTCPDDDDFLDTLFQHLDDQTWPAKHLRPPNPKWSDHAVDHPLAMDIAIEALRAGNSKGHSHPTIPTDAAREFFHRFDTLFETPKTYYAGMSLGNHAYVFQEGIAIVSSSRAGLLWVVESD